MGWIILALSIAIWGFGTVAGTIGSFLGWFILFMFVAVVFDQIFNKQNKE